MRGRPKVTIPDLDILIAEYQTGKHLYIIAKERGYHYVALRNRFKENGVKVRRGKSKIAIPDLDEIIAEYQAGKPLYVIAKERSYDTRTLENRFKENGIELRTAWETLKGRTIADEALAKKASTRFKRQCQINKGENEVASLLRDAGFSVTQQFPVGGYNLDIALTESLVAVEISYACASHFNKRNSDSRPQKDRIKYLCDKGWFVIYVIATRCNEKRTINLSIIRDELLTWLERACENNSLQGRFHVIWGNGSPPPHARYDFSGCPVLLSTNVPTN